MECQPLFRTKSTLLHRLSRQVLLTEVKLTALQVLRSLHLLAQSLSETAEVVTDPGLLIIRNWYNWQSTVSTTLTSHTVSARTTLPSISTSQQSSRYSTVSTCIHRNSVWKKRAPCASVVHFSCLIGCLYMHRWMSDEDNAKIHPGEFSIVRMRVKTLCVPKFFDRWFAQRIFHGRLPLLVTSWWWPNFLGPFSTREVLREILTP